MRFEVTSDVCKWEEQLSLFDSMKKDIYFTYDYYHLHEENGDGKAMVALYNGENGIIILYPFLIKTCSKNFNLKSTCCSIESAYGYGGPIVENYNSFPAPFWY